MIAILIFIENCFLMASIVVVPLGTIAILIYLSVIFAAICKRRWDKEMQKDRGDS